MCVYVFFLFYYYHNLMDCDLNDIKQTFLKPILSTVIRQFYFFLREPR